MAAAVETHSPGESPASSSYSAAPARGVTLDMFNELQLEVAELRAEIGRLRSVIQDLETKLLG
jgi:hypothetical protein